MSRSIHVTRKNFKGLSKSEINEQADDPTSDLNQWSKKKKIKEEVKAKRKNKKRDS
jgi:hypothetical protein